MTFKEIVEAIEKLGVKPEDEIIFIDVQPQKASDLYIFSREYVDKEHTRYGICG